MEKTMLESFCAAANLKALLLRGRDIPAVNQCAALVDNISELFSPDGNFNEAFDRLGEDAPVGRKKLEQLHPDIQVALRSNEELWKSRISGWTTPKGAVRHRRHTVRGFEFTTYAESRSLGTVFFTPDDSEILIPGRIQDIFSIETSGDNGVAREDFICVIKRYCGDPQPISCVAGMLPVYEDFGAHLWSSDLSETLYIIPMNRTLYHSISRAWSDGKVVMKLLNRVSVASYTVLIRGLTNGTCRH